MNNIEKKRFKLSIIVPLAFIIAMWTVYFFEYSLHLKFYEYGIYPRKLYGLPGIITAPFVHGDLKHLLSNTFPFLILSSGLFYFYKESAYKVFLLVWLVTGLWVWLAARSSYHIGASGMVYGFACFLFFAGLISKNRALAALSLLVVFIYGGMVWGLLPIKPGVSQESHIFGAITGLISALIFASKARKVPYSEPSNYNFLNEFSEPECSDTNFSSINYYLTEEKDEKKSE